MKDDPNQVIEAEKRAAANVILRRGGDRGDPPLANTAKLLEQNPRVPVRPRLESLERLAEMAAPRSPPPDLVKGFPPHP